MGDKEMENNTLNIRKRNGDNVGEMTIDQLIIFIKDEIFNRR
ncbi:MAG: His/Gly/Thr/Pro-type tRNA ligase C-terminal domain-containing protein [Nitrospirota bacterium]